tara:strand:+ start:779 stop:1096 length:318 start_codon:yes stop_codon:yes gene_type:complete
MTIKTNGTSLIGYTTKGYTPEAIAAALHGATHEVELRTADDFFDDKVTVEFIARINDTTVTIYNYKATPQDMVDIANGEYEWHVGGFDENAVLVLDAIGIDSRVR